MAIEDWPSVGRDVLAQMAAKGLNRSKVQQQAPVDNKTLQSLLGGTRTPSLDVQTKVEKVIGWPPGEMARRARGIRPEGRALEEFRDAELLSELLQRALRRETPGARAGRAAADPVSLQDRTPASDQTADSHDVQIAADDSRFDRDVGE